MIEKMIMEKELTNFANLIFKYKNKNIDFENKSFNDYLFSLHAEIPELFQNNSKKLSSEDKEVFLNFLKFYKKHLSQ